MVVSNTDATSSAFTIAADSFGPQAKHVDRLAPATPAKLMPEQQLALGVDADDDRVGGEGAERLGRQARCPPTRRTLGFHEMMLTSACG